MSRHRIDARHPRGQAREISFLTGADVDPFLRDAASTPGGWTPRVALPRNEAEVAAVLALADAVLPIGAQSSLTGGATPFGELVLSLSRMDAIGELRADRVRVGAGAALTTLEERLLTEGYFFPPVPTFKGATAGGIAATGAAGAATFKYGGARDWIRAITVVMADGGVVDVERGRCVAEAGAFEIRSVSGDIRRVNVPTYRWPNLPKCSAGYFAADAMDLVDLFVGSEGTLGVITEVDFRLRLRPPLLVGLAAFPAEAQALRAVGAMREASLRTWASGDPRGLDVAAIESLDRRSLDLLREDGKDREAGVRIPADAGTAILFQVELPAGTDADAAMEQIAGWNDSGAPDTGLGCLCRLLQEHGALDATELALPGDAAKAEKLLALREAVPVAVNHRVEAAQRADPEVRKVAGDMIVPFEALPEMLALYRDAFSRRGLDHAIWGHISDGNLHANVIPRGAADVARGDEALLELGAHALRLGGCPLSEHGVGRNRVKQELLRRVCGNDGIDQMRRVKQALDPEWKLAPGVLFPRAHPPA
jgi:D-lactate dehydrogenase (cytochrome)